MKPIRNLVFDMGGVILTYDLELGRQGFETLGLTNARELIGAYRQKGIFEDLECGRLDAEAFRDELSRMAGRPLTMAEVAKAWRAFIVHVAPYKLAYMDQLRANYPVWLLTNTNPYVMQWALSEGFTDAAKGIDRYVDGIVTSFEAGSMKPERKIFERLLQKSGFDPEETLYIDDGQTNLDTAAAMGFQTLLVNNGEDWREKINARLG